MDVMNIDVQYYYSKRLYDYLVQNEARLWRINDDVSFCDENDSAFLWKCSATLNDDVGTIFLLCETSLMFLTGNSRIAKFDF